MKMPCRNASLKSFSKVASAYPNRRATRHNSSACFPGVSVSDRYEISLFDDCVTICCYDHEKGGLQALVETTSSDMRMWAESYYEQFRKEAQPVKDAYEHGSLQSLE